MPYNPGVTDISGQLLSRGMEQAALMRAQAMGNLGSAIAGGITAFQKRKEEDEDLQAKAKAASSFLTQFADQFAPVDPTTGKPNTDSISKFLEKNMDETERQYAKRIIQAVPQAIDTAKMQQLSAATALERAKAEKEKLDVEEQKKAAEWMKQFGGFGAPAPTTQVPPAALSFAQDLSQRVPSMSAAPIQQLSALGQTAPIPEAAPVAAGAPSAPPLGNIPASVPAMLAANAPAANIPSGIGQFAPAASTAQAKLESVQPITIEDAAKALRMAPTRQNMPFLLQQQRIMQKEQEMQAREQRASGVLYKSEEDAQAAADQFNEDPKNVGIVAMVQPDATRGGFAVKKQTTSLKTPAQEAATAAAVEEAKLTTQRAGELNTKIAQEALDAAQDRPRLQRIKELYRAGAQSGFGQDWLITSKGILATLGFGDASKIKDGQELQALLEKDAFSQAQRYLKGGGSISNQERASMSKISQSFNKVEGANLALINMTEAAYNKSEAAENYRAGLEQQPGMDERKIAASMRVWIRDPKNSLERFAPRDSGIPPKGTVVIQKGVKYVSDGFTMTQIN